MLPLLLVLTLCMLLLVLALVWALWRRPLPPPPLPDQTQALLVELATLRALTTDRLAQVGGDLKTQRQELAQSLGTSHQGLAHALATMRTTAQAYDPAELRDGVLARFARQPVANQLMDVYRRAIRP